jgi:predicted DNA-binding transcriptional regulator YafY
MPEPVTFTRDELFEMALLCQISFERFTVVDDNNLKNIWEKIKATFDKKEIAQIRALVFQELKEIEGPSEWDKIDPEILRQVREALEKEQRLRIRYYTANTGETTERVIRPHEIADESIGPYLSAFCELRDADRLFNLNAIEQIYEILPPLDE